MAEGLAEMKLMGPIGWMWWCTQAIAFWLAMTGPWWRVVAGVGLFVASTLLLYRLAPDGLRDKMFVNRAQRAESEASDGHGDGSGGIGGPSEPLPNAIRKRSLQPVS